MSEFRLGTERPSGGLTCCFGVSEPACNQSAEWHVLWPDLTASAACGTHMLYIIENADIAYEAHPHGSDCGMPGTMWHHPYEDEEFGYCFTPMVDDLALTAAEDQPLDLTTAPTIRGSQREEGKA